MDVQAAIKNQVTSNPVVLYMKGSPKFPQCGFSGLAIQILQACGVQNLVAVDVMGLRFMQTGQRFHNYISTVNSSAVRTLCALCMSKVSYKNY